LKPAIGNESIHQDSNDNGFRIINLATSKNLAGKSTMFPHRNIHKHTWTSSDGKAQNEIDVIFNIVARVCVCVCAYVGGWQSRFVVCVTP
jgi:hypothetical protein